MNQPARAVDRDSFLRGALFGMVVMIGVEGLHWMVTGAGHPDASALRKAAVIVQTVGSFLIAAWLYYRAGRAPSESNSAPATAADQA